MDDKVIDDYGGKEEGEDIGDEADEESNYTDGIKRGVSDDVIKKRNKMEMLMFVFWVAMPCGLADTNVSEEHSASIFRADEYCNLIEATFKMQTTMMMPRCKITNLTNAPRNRPWPILQLCVWTEQWTKTTLDVSHDLIEEPTDGVISLRHEVHLQNI
jgi:hypothetical protein